MGSSLILNPNTSLAWLPPKIATEVEICRYILMCIYGAWLWDILMSIPEDIKIFRRFTFSMTDAVYIMARISVFGFLTSSVLFAVAPIEGCVNLGKAAAWFTAVALPPNSFLFLIRVWAVFHDSRLIKWIFVFLWLAVIAGGISQPFCLGYGHIGPSKNCMLTLVKPFCSAGVVALTVLDVLVLVAISIKLLLSSLADDWMGRLKIFFSGKGMLHVSRLLLKTGQQYVAVTAVMNLVTIAVIFTPSIPLSYRAMVAIPDTTLFNIMACRIYRKLKLGAITNGETNRSSSRSTTRRGGSSIRFATISMKPGAGSLAGIVGQNNEVELERRETQSTRVDLQEEERVLDIRLDDKTTQDWEVLPEDHRSPELAGLSMAVDVKNRSFV